LVGAKPGSNPDKDMEQNKTLEVQKNERIHENKKNRLYFLSVGNLPIEIGQWRQCYRKKLKF
jgi:hypothetical protein